jgi:diguanylate cyclase (GGDEF)-like protein
MASSKRWASTAATASSIGFAFALIGMVWLHGYQQLGDSHEMMRRELAIKAANLAVAFEHNVAVTSNDLDRLLIYLRHSRYLAGDDITWQSLIKEPFTIAEQSVQIAVTDKNGMMITSTAMLYPKEPVDLSDREHFKFHLNSKQDVLFISKPVVGRASGKRSVQYARRLTEPDGSFAGILVVSLDPEYVTRTYSKLDLGATGGLVLNGSDGIVRAGTGSFQAAIGMGFREGTPLKTLESRDPETHIEIQRFPDGRKIVATRQVMGYPLEVVVAIEDVESASGWTAAQQSLLAWSTGISCMVLVVLLLAVAWQRRTDSILLHVAKNDSLTGLANRLSFHSELSDALRTSSSGIALHVVDLDGFKQVNDSFGHPTGDKILVAVSERLLLNVRSTDIVARLGGDEFAILQRNVGTDDSAESLASRICRSVGQPFVVDGNTIKIGASVGIARAPDDAETVDDLFSAADIALYSAKSQGGRIFRRFCNSMNLTVQDHRELERELKLAIEDDRLTLHYQPIICINSRKVVGFEALLRWVHKERGFVPPSIFIPLAERTGVIDEIGAWVIARACQDAAKWPDDLGVAVNCSPIQFSRGTLPACIAEALKDSGLEPSRLDIEITESTLMQHDNATLNQLQEIRNLGVHLSMDDFGTGYSSLSYLQTYPFSSLKIDRSFIQSLNGSDNKTAIIKSIVNLANTLEMKTVAEGIETAEQLAVIGALGCAQAQGYLFARPAPVEEAIAWLEKYNAEESARAAAA